MKIAQCTLAALLVAFSSFAQAERQPVDADTDALVRKLVPVCADLKISRTDLREKLPTGMTGRIIVTEGKRPACTSQYALIQARSGGYFLGSPWFLGDTAGASLEQKIQNFTWSRMKQNFTAVVDRQRTPEGLFPVTLYQTVEGGRIPMAAEIDPEGTVLFFGRFQRNGADAAAERVKALDPFLTAAPVRGTKDSTVTIVEFSDFQCPSCKHSAGYVEPMLNRLGDRVRYIRYDLPLISGHPWALSAAIAGRAIHRQKPELFWEYKKQVYESQDKLSAFTIDEFARNFAADHDLDMNRYDADVSSPEIRESLLKAVGAAFSADVRGTPTFMVNGVFVDAGDDGKALESYIRSLVANKS